MYIFEKLWRHQLLFGIVSFTLTLDHAHQTINVNTVNGIDIAAKIQALDETVTLYESPCSR